MICVPASTRRSIVSSEQLGIGLDGAAQQRVLLLHRLAIARELVIVTRLALRERAVEKRAARAGVPLASARSAGTNVTTRILPRYRRSERRSR